MIWGPPVGLLVLTVACFAASLFQHYRRGAWLRVATRIDSVPEPTRIKVTLAVALPVSAFLVVLRMVS